MELALKNRSYLLESSMQVLSEITNCTPVNESDTLKFISEVKITEDEAQILVESLVYFYKTRFWFPPYRCFIFSLYVMGSCTDQQKWM